MDKKIVLLIVVIGILLTGSFLFLRGTQDNISGNVINEQEIENLHKVNLDIEDMYCDACALGVRAQIEELEGVVSADINAWTASGVVLYDADKVDAQTIADASTVYPATVINDEKLN